MVCNNIIRAVRVVRKALAEAPHRGLRGELENRVKEFRGTMAHKRIVQDLARPRGYSFPLHDSVKAIHILLWGDEVATALHREFSRHHLHDGDIVNKVEAALDWESARFTKPSKPLNAYETWLKFYSNVNMEATLRHLGLWPSQDQ